MFLEKLIDFYKEDPKDPFNIYGLAIEYLKTDSGKSQLLFEELLRNHPKYIATYYHAAALYFQKSELKLAKITYLTGIDMATKLNKNHALNELKRAYQGFLDEIDEN